eukprot:364703-Chlamydomonas_euryale.AAC.14
MVDAAAADQARVSLAARIGEAAAEGLIPHQPREEQALQRAELLMGTVSGRAHGMLPGVRLQGTGPFGMATPADVQDTVDQLRAAALKVRPAEGWGVASLSRGCAESMPAGVGGGEVSFATCAHRLQQEAAASFGRAGELRFAACAYRLQEEASASFREPVAVMGSERLPAVPACAMHSIQVCV